VASHGKPGLARADRGARRRFVAIALGIGVDDEATDAFVYAYRAQGPDDRRRLADAVARDLDGAGHDPGRALAALFMAEDDPGVLAHLWARIRHVDAPPSCAAGTLGDEAEGGVYLALAEAQGLFVLYVAWRADQTTLEAGPARTEAEARGRLATLAPAGAKIREVPLAWAIDEAAERVWRHLRGGGALPAGAERFAPLFSASV
jgi:hypothetical protein